MLEEGKCVEDEVHVYDCIVWRPRDNHQDASRLEVGERRPCYGGRPEGHILHLSKRCVVPPTRVRIEPECISTMASEEYSEYLSHVKQCVLVHCTTWTQAGFQLVYKTRIHLPANGGPTFGLETSFCREKCSPNKVTTEQRSPKQQNLLAKVAGQWLPSNICRTQVAEQRRPNRNGTPISSSLPEK